MRTVAPPAAEAKDGGSAGLRPQPTRLSLLQLAGRALRLRCLLCGKDKPFVGGFGMRRYCRSCGYIFERERGYFLGSADVNFWVTFVLLVPLALGGFILFDDPGYLPVYVCLAFVVCFPLWFFRYSKTLYMLIDICLDPPSEADFAVRDEETARRQHDERERRRRPY